MNCEMLIELHIKSRHFTIILQQSCVTTDSCYSGGYSRPTLFMLDKLIISKLFKKFPT